MPSRSPSHYSRLLAHTLRAILPTFLAVITLAIVLGGLSVAKAEVVASRPPNPAPAQRSSGSILPRVVATIPLGTLPRAVAVNPATGYAYTANSNGTSTVLSGSQVITTLAVSVSPGVIGVNPTSGYIYVADTLSNTVTVLSGTQIVATLPGCGLTLSA